MTESESNVSIPEAVESSLMQENALLKKENVLLKQEVADLKQKLQQKLFFTLHGEAKEAEILDGPEKVLLKHVHLAKKSEMKKDIGAVSKKQNLVPPPIPPRPPLKKLKRIPSLLKQFGNRVQYTRFSDLAQPTEKYGKYKYHPLQKDRKNCTAFQRVRDVRQELRDCNKTTSARSVFTVGGEKQPRKHL